jgi:tetratricopeptide (TPR) repeat protein
LQYCNQYIAEEALELLDSLVYRKTGERLGTTQRIILRNLWEIEKASEIFYYVKNLATTDRNYYQYVVYSLCCLAYLDSSVGNNENVTSMLREAEEGLSHDRLTSWGIGTSLLFLSLTYKNLGLIDKALLMCHQAINHCRQNQFSFLEARATSCLASLYREQGQFTVAIDKHLEAILPKPTTSWV